MHAIKKLIILICIFKFLFPCEADANLDGLVNIQDVVISINYTLLIEIPSLNIEWACDLNYDYFHIFPSFQDFPIFPFLPSKTA